MTDDTKPEPEALLEKAMLRASSLGQTHDFYQAQRAVGLRAQPPAQLPLFAAKVAHRKWVELQQQGYRMQRLRFESPERAGEIDPWGVVTWLPPAGEPSEAEIEAAARALIGYGLDAGSERESLIDSSIDGWGALHRGLARAALMAARQGKPEPGEWSDERRDAARGKS